MYLKDKTLFIICAFKVLLVPLKCVEKNFLPVYQ